MIFIFIFFLNIIYANRNTLYYNTILKNNNNRIVISKNNHYNKYINYIVALDMLDNNKINKLIITNLDNEIMNKNIDILREIKGNNKINNYLDKKMIMKINLYKLVNLYKEKNNPKTLILGEMNSDTMDIKKITKTWYNGFIIDVNNDANDIIIIKRELKRPKYEEPNYKRLL